MNTSPDTGTTSREQKEPLEEHSTVLGTAHPNIMNCLMSTDEAVKSRGATVVMTVPDVIVNPFWASYQSLAPKPSSQPQTLPSVSNSNINFLNAYQRPVVSLTPTFKRPCSEATLAKLKKKFAKSTSPIPLAGMSASLECDPFQTSILKDILLGNRAKPEVPMPSLIPAKSGAVNEKVTAQPPLKSPITVSINVPSPKPTTVTIIDDDDDDICLISATSRATTSTKNSKENRFQISNQNRSSVICKIPSSEKQLPSREVHNCIKTVSRSGKLSMPAIDISGKHFIDSIFNNIMFSNAKNKKIEEKKSSSFQPHKPEVTQSLPKSDHIQSPAKPIILEAKASPSCASALCALLQTKSEPGYVIKPPPLEGSTNRVYQQMIEFEYNHEFIVKKFKQQEGSSFSSSFSTKLELNPLEKMWIDELSNSFTILHNRCLFSEMTATPALLGPQTKTESLVNLLIHITSQLVTFSSLNTLDQMSLISENVIELLLLRSLLIKPNCISEKFGEKDDETSVPSNDDNEIEDNDNEESNLIIEEEEEEVRQFKDMYQRLTHSIDKNWCKDKTIFNLVSSLIPYFLKKCIINF